MYTCAERWDEICTNCFCSGTCFCFQKGRSKDVKVKLRTASCTDPQSSDLRFFSFDSENSFEVWIQKNLGNKDNLNTLILY